MAKELVLYFSVYGTAKRIAGEIARQTGADIREIVPAVPYDGNRDHYPALLRTAQKEHDSDARPAIRESLPIADYDRIYIGYPIWCYTFPMIIYTLFGQNDFSGKTVIPFNTHMGSRDGGTYETIRELAPKAKILPGLSVEMRDAETDPAGIVSKWLDTINGRKGAKQNAAGTSAVKPLLGSPREVRYRGHAVGL